MLHLSVTDPERALTVWRDLVGLEVLGRRTDSVTLGAGGRPLVALHPDAVRPAAEAATGLYHAAIHVPTRKELASVYLRCRLIRHPAYLSDHTVSEAVYLWDPDGNGIEITFETPERGEFFTTAEGVPAVRTPDGALRQITEPLDPGSLLRELGPDGIPSGPLSVGTKIGHLHLRVSHVGEAMRFYRDGIGLTRQLFSDRMRFGDLTLDRYVPHLIAVNSWESEGAHKASEGTAGLVYFTLLVQDTDELSALRERLAEAGAGTVDAEDGGFFTSDPSANRMLVRREEPEAVRSV